MQSKNRRARARVTMLEVQVVQLEKRVTPAQRKSAPSATSPRKRQTRNIDPGDAVPEGVAVQEPAPLDAAETALENLIEDLGADQPE
jgi:hypothetical protein